MTMMNTMTGHLLGIFFAAFGLVGTSLN